MNPKILGAFAGGVLASGAIFYFISNRESAPPAPPAKTVVAAKVIEPVASPPPEDSPKPVERVEKPAVSQRTPNTAKSEVRPVVRRERWPVAAKALAGSAAIAPSGQTQPPSPVAARAQAPPEPVPEKPAPAPVTEVAKAAPVETPKPAEVAHKESIPLTPPSSASQTSSSPSPEPRKVTLSGGTLFTVRLAEPLSSSKQKSGDPFRATLDQPVIVDGLVIAERGASIEGRVVEAEKAGKTSGTSRLQLELIRFTSSDGQTVGIRTSSYEQEGKSSGSSKTDAAKKVGIGAAAGAVLGGIIGGGKGAGIGAATGGAAGGGVVLATRGKPVEVPAETRMTFRLSDPVVITEKINR